MVAMKPRQEPGLAGYSGLPIKAGKLLVLVVVRHQYVELRRQLGLHIPLRHRTNA